MILQTIQLFYFQTITIIQITDTLKTGNTTVEIPNVKISMKSDK